MGDEIEATAQTVMTDVVTAMSDDNRSGWECMPMTRSGNVDRLAFCYVTLPNGQQFKITVEEMI